MVGNFATRKSLSATCQAQMLVTCRIAANKSRSNGREFQILSASAYLGVVVRFGKLED